MSRNKYQKQVWVLPEDDANRQILQGFILEQHVRPRAIHMLPVAGGWTALRDSFKREYNDSLRNHPECLMVLLVDFDGQSVERLQRVLSGVDDTLKDRVFVLGSKSEPEKLKTALGMNYEAIGRTLARECFSGQHETWMHELLAHNRQELERMTSRVKPVLFG
ncbi:MAG: hypothetical protein ACKO6N_12810 [Myxococcota bacterium]